MFFGECPTRVSCRSAGLWWQEDITHNSAVFAHLLYQHHRRQQRDTTLCCDFYILWSGFWSNCDALVPYNCQIEDSILMIIDDGLIDCVVVPLCSFCEIHVCMVTRELCATMRHPNPRLLEPHIWQQYVTRRLEWLSTGIAISWAIALTYLKRTSWPGSWLFKNRYKVRFTCWTGYRSRSIATLVT